ncbi:hypothetical protein BTVI_154349 [Pitangus sulphuratus]|nr:hypothetical protein BTVI_154349 [Pitangus sulphuratus]
MLLNVTSSHFLNTSGDEVFHSRGHPVPVLDNPFCEEIVPDVQPEPPLVLFEAMSSSVTSCLGEEINPNLATTAFQVVVESDPSLAQLPEAVVTEVQDLALGLVELINNQLLKYLIRFPYYEYQISGMDFISFECMSSLFALSANHIIMLRSLLVAS